MLATSWTCWWQSRASNFDFFFSLISCLVIVVVVRSTPLPSARSAPHISVEPPLNPAHAPIAQPIRDLVKQRIRTVDRAIHTAHALILDRGLDRGPARRVVQRDAAAAVGVRVGEGAHEGEGQRDGEVG